MNVPREDYEAEVLANWLRFNGYLFNNIMNETDYHSISKGAKRKRLGVNSGCPDFIILLKSRGLLFIEMKRQRQRLKNGNLGASPSKVSDEQIIWIENLNKIDNVEACICYGADEAIKKIIDYENKEKELKNLKLNNKKMIETNKSELNKYIILRDIITTNKNKEKIRKNLKDKNIII